MAPRSGIPLKGLSLPDRSPSPLRAFFFTPIPIGFFHVPINGGGTAYGLNKPPSDVEGGI